MSESATTPEDTLPRMSLFGLSRPLDPITMMSVCSLSAFCVIVDAGDEDARMTSPLTDATPEVLASATTLSTYSVASFWA